MNISPKIKVRRTSVRVERITKKAERLCNYSSSTLPDPKSPCQIVLYLTIICSLTSWHSNLESRTLHILHVKNMVLLNCSVFECLLHPSPCVTVFTTWLQYIIVMMLFVWLITKRGLQWIFRQGQGTQICYSKVLVTGRSGIRHTEAIQFHNVQVPLLHK